MFVKLPLIIILNETISFLLSSVYNANSISARWQNSIQNVNAKKKGQLQTIKSIKHNHRNIGSVSARIMRTQTLSTVFRSELSRRWRGSWHPVLIGKLRGTGKYSIINGLYCWSFTGSCASAFRRFSRLAPVDGTSSERAAWSKRVGKCENY